MERLDSIAALNRWSERAPGTVGFVPTMGYLHDGHLSLVRRSRVENQQVVVSIFVNPTQFGPSEDFGSYPRDLARDLAALEREKVDAVFMPATEEIYPEGYATYVSIERITERWEGALRPGHFRGVATVVLKLFTLVRPTRVYFGQKDYQQLLVIKRMARDLDLPVKIVGCPIVREPDGLAMSSRNAYLSPGERQAATVLFRALKAAEAAFGAGVRSGAVLRQAMEELLAREPLARIDYVAVADPETLEPLQIVEQRGAVCCLAVRIGRARLIDNLLLGTTLNDVAG